MAILVYQLYPIAWRGGLKGITEFLPRVAALGVDYIWLSPVYPSPFNDGGYDVANYKAISPTFGVMADFDRLVTQAHSLGIGVLMDLVMNHTSTKHPWFRQEPEYYCWEPTLGPGRDDLVPRPGWRNLFNGGPAWAYDREMDVFYLHLFHETQADLNWFPGDKLNQNLVQEFREIVDFWTKEHGVDGFRLDVPQAINKDFSLEELTLEDLLFGDKAADVISAVFKGREDLFLMVECFDPTMGKLVEYYATNTPVDFVCNVLLKDEIEKGTEHFLEALYRQTRDPHFMLELESHDSPRFPSRGMPPDDMIWTMFNSGAQGICLYQGQELGLSNPTKRQLPNELMCKLDAQTAMRFIKREELDDLRPLSRANARIPIPMVEYGRQEADIETSYLGMTRHRAKLWKR